MGLEALGLKPFVEKDIDEEKLKKPLTGVLTLPARGATSEWEAWFQAFESAVVTKGVPLEKWAVVLIVHTSADLQPIVHGPINLCKKIGCRCGMCTLLCEMKFYPVKCVIFL